MLQLLKDLRGSLLVLLFKDLGREKNGAYVYCLSGRS
jgi:hypothetical protein